MASQEKITLNINAKNKAKGILSSVKNQIIGIGVAYLGWKFVTTMLGDSIKAAVHTNKVYNDLSASVERHGMVWKNVEKSLRSYTDTMQTATGVSDELIAKGLQAFIDFGADTVGAMDSMNVALDLAAGSNIELTAAVDLLSKASVGYTGTLSRYGIIIDQAIPASDRFAEAIKQINQKFGGAAAARMETSAGKISLLSEKFGDFQETLGKFVIPALDLAVAGLTNFLDLLAGSQGIIAMTEQDVEAKIKIAEQLEILRQKYDDGSVSLDEFNTQSQILIEGGKILAGVIHLTADEMLNELLAVDNLTVGWESHNLIIGDATTAGIKMAETLGLQAQRTADLADAMKKAEERIAAATKMRQEDMNLSTNLLERNTLSTEIFTEAIDTAGRAQGGLGRVLIKTWRGSAEANAAATQKISGAFGKIKAAGASWGQFQRGVGNAAANALSGSMNNAVSSIVGSLGFLQTESKGVFKNMAVDFMRFFITEVLQMAAKVLVVKLLKILSGIFDTRANDMMAATQGRHFIQWFTHGVVDELEANNLGALIVPRVSIPNLSRQAGGGSGGGAQIIINFNAPVSDEQFIRDSVIPVLEQAIFDRETIIVREDANITGREQFVGAQF